MMTSSQHSHPSDSGLSGCGPDSPVAAPVPDVVVAEQHDKLLLEFELEPGAQVAILGSLAELPSLTKAGSEEDPALVLVFVADTDVAEEPESEELQQPVAVAAAAVEHGPETGVMVA
jgi:hypothetical protein